MREYITLEVIIMATWLFFIIVKKIRNKKGDLDILLFVPALTAYILFVILELADITFLYLQSYIYVGFAFSLLIFDGKNLSKKDKTKDKLKTLKKDYDNLAERSELLRERFIHMLELVDDGIAFRSDDDTMFGTQNYLKLIPFDDNEFSFEALLMKMHPDDKQSYLEAIQKVSRKKPTYTVHYRIKKEGDYHWFKEKGFRLQQHNRKMYINVVKGVDVKRYPETNIEVLNNLTIDRAYYEHIQSLNRKRSPYSIVTFEMTNIPQVNSQYGRDIGDLLMGEYIKKLAYHFLKDIHSVFRLSGIRFAMVITDHRKVEMLKRALEEGGDLINHTMTFGNVTESVYPCFGILHVKMFDEPVDEIAERADKALNIALEDNTTDNYFIIR